jgi:hypothetical protein
MNDEKKKPPVHNIKQGAVKCTIWERQGKHGPWYEATFVRLWKDDEKDQWHESATFGERHLRCLT